MKGMTTVSNLSERDMQELINQNRVPKKNNAELNMSEFDEHIAA